MAVIGKERMYMSKEKKLTIVQINALGKTRSTGRTTWEMHEYFEKNGIKSYIATADGRDCPEGYAVSSMPFMHLDTVMSILTGLECYHSTLHTQKFLNYLDKIKPDVVHLRVLHNSFINLKMLLKYLAENNIATVVTLHDFWFMTGKCCYYTELDCNRWQTGCYDCPAMATDARRRLFDRTPKMWRDKKAWFEKIEKLAVIGNSQWTTNEARSSFLQNAKIVDCVYNWIDFEEFYPRTENIVRKELGLENKKIILGVSTFWEENSTKGFSSYLELAKSMPENYHILLVGTLKSDVELPHNVTVLPATNDKERLAQYYSEADVYLNLSERETFGKVSAEAVSCGTPLIALNNTANPEIVPEGAGEVIDSADAQTILSALDRLFAKEKSEYVDKCIEHTRKNFDKQKNIEKYIEIYNKLLIEE